MAKKSKQSDYLREFWKTLTLKHYLFFFIFVSLLAVFFIFFYRKSSHITVQIQLTEQNPLHAQNSPPFWLIQAIHEGSKERDASGKVKAEVLKVVSYPLEGDRDVAYLTVELEVIHNLKQNQYTFKGKPVSVGSPLDLVMDGVFVQGLVVKVNEETQPQQTKTVEAKLLYEFNQQGSSEYGVNQWLADAIRIGDEMKDAEGNVIARVLDKREEPAQYVFTDANGNVLVRNHPFKKFVNLRLELQTNEVGGVSYFMNSIPVRVGNNLPLFLPKATIYADITNLL